MATQADGLTSSVPDPLSEVLGCGLDSGDDRRQAQAYAVQAAQSAVQADADAKSAGNAAVRAESWAAGGTGTRTGEDADNAEYYAGQAKTSATAAAADRAAAETASQTAVSKAEAAAASAEAAAKSAIEAKPSDVATQSTNGLMSAADKTKLDGIAENANNYTHPGYTAQASGLYKVTVDSTGHVSAAAAVDKSDITALGIPESDTTYSAATTSAEGLMSAADKTKLDGVTAGANNYTHPGYTAQASGLYKVTVDSTGHVSAAAAVDKSDITALGIPESDTTYSAATTSAEGLMSAADKTKLDGVTAGANKYTHPSYTARASGLYKVTVDSTGHVSAAAAVDKSDITALGVPAQDTTYTHPSYTARASGLYKVTVDSTGHVSAAAAVDKSDITALGVPAQDTTYTHPSYTARASGLYKVTVDSTGHVSAATAVTKSDITALGIPIGEDHEITFSNIATGITIPGIGSSVGKSKNYCYTVGKLGFLSITFENKYNTSGTAIAAGKTLFYVEGVPKSIHTRYGSQDEDDGDFIAIRSRDGEQYILEATHISTGALMIKAKEAIPAGYMYKINVVFVEV